MSPATGRTLGPYEIRSLIGAGGMGEVYRARDRRLNRDVAIKLLPPNFASDSVRRRRFTQEAQAASALNHPNIVSVYDVSLDADQPYIVSELVEGSTLKEAMGGHGMPIRKLLDIAVQIADGLTAAHDAGIVHRDLKPGNILIGRDGRAKIADFGLASHVQNETLPANSETAELTLTKPGIAVGTLNYMSPEQAAGKTVDTRSDIFSFGVILYEMVRGKRPFDGLSAPDTLAAIMHRDQPPLGDELPRPLCWTIRRCLEKDPGQRYQSTRDLYFDLRQQRDDLHIAVLEPLGTVKISRPRYLIPAAILAVLIGTPLAIFSTSLLSRSAEPGLQASQFHPLVTGPEFDDAAAWSPDGRNIAYQSTVDRRYQIFAKSLDAETPQQLTHGAADCKYPAWSPDGASVYYTMSRAVWRVSAAGGDARMVIDGVDTFALSRDGKQLAFLRMDFNPQRVTLYLSSPPGANPEPYTPPPVQGPTFNRAYLAFSPDAKQLLFWVSMVDQDRPSEFWMLPLPPGTAKPRRVLQSLNDSFLVTGLSWLDNSRIVVASTRPPDLERTHLYVADTAKDTIRPLVVGIGDEESPSVSPAGNVLAYTAVELDMDVVAIPLDGSAVHPVISSNRFENAPSWSRHSNQMAYVTDRRGAQEIWVTTLERGWDKPIVTPQSFPGGASKIIDSPAFSPDGDRIAFSRDARIWIVPASGGAPVRLTTAESFQLAPTWSPDAEWIAYYSRGSQAGIMKARVGGSAPPTLVKAVPIYPCGNCSPVWSPAGDWIAFSTPEATYLTTPDGVAERVIRKPALAAIGWSADGATLYGVTSLPKQALVAINAATGKETSIAAIDPQRVIGQRRLPGISLSLSPDGKSLATTSIRRTGDIWMLENFDHPRGLFPRLGITIRPNDARHM